MGNRGRSAAVAMAAAFMFGTGAVPTSAQGTVDVESIRTMLQQGLEVHRGMDRAFVEAIPDSALRWAPTEGVRDFAEQIEHIVLDNPLIVAAGLPDTDPPEFGDPEIYLNDKAALARLVDATYDWTAEFLARLPAERLVQETTLFGQETTVWRLFLAALHHADWTRGQLVPYYRLNGIEPPAWRIY